MSWWWDGGLGFLVGNSNGWVNCFTNNSFLTSFGWQRLHSVYVFFRSLTSMTCQSLMQVIYMSDSEDEELEASLVLQVIPELEPLKSRGTRFQQEFCMFPLFDFGASQTSPWNDKLLDVVGGGTMFEASSQQHGHLNGWTNSFCRNCMMWILDDFWKLSMATWGVAGVIKKHLARKWSYIS